MKKYFRVILVTAMGAALGGMVGITGADTISVPPAADTFINSGSPNNNAGSNAWFDAGTDGTGGMRRGLLRFDLSGIPPGSTVTSAVVQLTVTRVPSSGAVDSTFDLFRLLASWTEGTKIGNAGAAATAGESTWIARMLGTANWTTPGAKNDAVATASASVPVTGAGTYSWSSATLVSDAQIWVNNPSTNFGWLLASESEGSLKSVRGFAARESGVSVGTLQIGFVSASTSNQPPSVTITNPLNGASFIAPATFAIQATASDTNGTVTNVQFFANTTLLGADAIAPYSIIASNLGVGSYALTARATDNGGLTSTSAPVNITVGTVSNQPPSVTITNPPDGASFIAPATFIIQATASDTNGTVTNVQFFANFTLLGADAIAPYSITASNLGVGSYALTARATDNGGLTTTSAPVNISVGSGSNQPLSVTITNPPDNAVFGNTDPVTVAALTSDPNGSVTNVQFFDGLVLLRNISGPPPYSFTTAPFTFTLGVHTLTAVAADNLGAMATSAPVHLTVARYTPEVTNGAISLFLVTVATNMAAPLYGISPPGDTHRLFVLEQNGLMRIIQDGALLPGAALDIQNRVQPPLNAANPNDERGLLGLAFHPGFNAPASPGYRTLYTYNSEMIPSNTLPTYPVPTTATNNYMNVVNEWKISTTNANVVDPSSRRAVISFGKNAGNHNGGTCTFGPDGYMYLALGDGGNANDVGPSHIEPGGNAQNLSTPLGKMLRFDPLNPILTTNSPNPISSNGQYRIPTTNPFQGPGQAPEIYAYGLRNPYRFAFDSVTGDLIEADVGQNNIEEINRITMGGNYGWAVKEGDFLFNRTNGPAGPAGTIGPPPGYFSPGVPAGLIDPITGPQGILEYDHNNGISISGGFVYRGSAMPQLYGKYIFGDLALVAAPVRINGRLFYADLQAGTINVFPLPQFGNTSILPNGATVHGFGQDAAGELYALVTTTPANGTGGVVYKLTVTNRCPLVFTAQLSGAQESPTNASTARGTATVVLSVDETQITVNESFSGLTAPATASHIHGPAGPGTNAAVVFPFSGVPAATAGSIPQQTFSITPTQVVVLKSGLYYANVHDSVFPGGEIRGQLLPASPIQMSCSNIVAECTGGLTPVTYIVTATDCNGSVPVTCMPPSGTGFPIGTSNVVCTAGSGVNCGFTVTVADTTPPVITCATNRQVECGTPWTFDRPSAVDSCAGTNVTIGIVNTVTNALCGATFRATRTWSATDAAGNSNSCSQTITVVDTTAPAIACSTNILRDATSPAGAQVTFTTTAMDVCAGSVPVVCQPPSGALFPVGTNTVNCAATDGCGNSNSCSFRVVVRLSPRGMKEGVLAEMIALRASVTDARDGKELDKAIKTLGESLAPELWIDALHLERKHGEKAIQAEEQTVDTLCKLIKAKQTKIPDVTLQGFIDRIVAADRLLAVTAIQEATAAGGNLKKIADANKELVKGDAEAAQGNCNGIIGHYKNAWRLATQAAIKISIHVVGGYMQVEILGAAGERYAVQSSTNLRDWATIGTVTASDDGTATFTDPAPAAGQLRFYRVAKP